MMIKRANILFSVNKQRQRLAISRMITPQMVHRSSPYSTTNDNRSSDDEPTSTTTTTSTTATTTSHHGGSHSSKMYAGMSRDQVEAKLREQGIKFTGGKQKVQMTKWVNPILHRSIEYELVKPAALGADISRKAEMATRILARSFLEEQKTEEYRQETIESKASDVKQIEESIKQVQQRVLEKLKKKKAYTTDRDTSIFVGLYPAKLMPKDADEATDFQMKLIQYLLTTSEQQLKDPQYSHKYQHPFELKGWKVGATQPKVQATNGLQKPFLGPIFSHQVYRQESDSDKINLRNTLIGQLMPQAECEFAFHFKKALPARAANQEPYTREQVAECIGEVIPAMELVGSRIEDISFGSGSKAVDVSGKEFFLKIADCGSHLALLLGPHTIQNPSLEDLENLYASKVEFNMNEDEEIIHGQGNNVYEGQINASSTVGPLDTTTWAVNEITAHVSEGGRGMEVSAGTLISSGTMTGKSRQIDNGDRIVASFTNVPTYNKMTVQVSADF